MKNSIFLIGKSLDYEDMFAKNLNKEASLQYHICAYILSLIYLKRHDPLLDKKKIIWQKFIVSKNLKYYYKLMEFKVNEDQIIVEALNKMEEESKNMKDMGVGTAWKPYTWGMLTYEYDSI
jgi:hypothetical protein